MKFRAPADVSSSRKLEAIRSVGGEISRLTLIRAADSRWPVRQSSQLVLAVGSRPAVCLPGQGATARLSGVFRHSPLSRKQPHNQVTACGEHLMESCDRALGP